MWSKNGFFFLSHLPLRASLDLLRIVPFAPANFFRGGGGSGGTGAVFCMNEHRLLLDLFFSIDGVGGRGGNFGVMCVCLFFFPSIIINF